MSRKRLLGINWSGMQDLSVEKKMREQYMKREGNKMKMIEDEESRLRERRWKEDIRWNWKNYRREIEKIENRENENSEIDEIESRSLLTSE
jgi:hypothetical protein